MTTVPAPPVGAVNESETAPSGETGAAKVAFADALTVIVPFATVNSNVRDVSGHLIDELGIKTDSACQVSACAAAEMHSPSPRTVRRFMALFTPIPEGEPRSRGQGSSINKE